MMEFIEYSGLFHSSFPENFRSKFFDPERPQYPAGIGVCSSDACCKAALLRDHQEQLKRLEEEVQHSCCRCLQMLSKLSYVSSCRTSADYMNAARCPRRVNVPLKGGELSVFAAFDLPHSASTFGLGMVVKVLG